MPNLIPDQFHASDETRKVLLDLAQERRRQINRGWTPEHDDRHSTKDMVHLSGYRLSRSGLPGADVRKLLIQAAAILVSAVEVLDRRGK